MLGLRLSLTRLREAGLIVSQAVLIAIGIDWGGRRQMLSVELVNRESRSYNPAASWQLPRQWRISNRVESNLQPLRVGVVEDFSGEMVGRITAREGDGIDQANQAMLETGGYVCGTQGSHAAEMGGRAGRRGAASGRRSAAAGHRAAYRPRIRYDADPWAEPASAILSPLRASAAGRGRDPFPATR